MMTTVAAALAGGNLLERLNVPAGALIGAMAAVAALNLSSWDAAEFPGWARFLAFAGIGWALGQQINRESLEALRGSLIPIAIVVAGLLLAGVLMMLVLRAAGVDAATAFLAASPGGISQMGAISAAVNANAAVVMTTHLVRIIVVVVAAPLVAGFLLGD